MGGLSVNPRRRNVNHAFNELARNRIRAIDFVNRWSGCKSLTGTRPIGNLEPVLGAAASEIHPGLGE